MKKLKSLDLYTALILICVILLPVCGWWCLKTQEQIDLCEDAIYDGRKPGGFLQDIGALQKQIEIVNNNRSGNISQPSTYFQGQILAAAAAGGQLTSTDFSITSPKQETAQIRGSKQKAIDYVVDVVWKNRELALKLDFIDSVLWNCESGASRRGANNMQSVWKLRELSIVNLTNEKDLAAKRTPPPELDDRWAIRELRFARREPSK